MAEERIPVGLRTCSVHPSRRFDLASLRLMRDAGFQLAELSFNRPAHGVAHDDRVLAASFRRRAEAWGMTLLAHAPDAYWLSNPDQGERRETVAAARGVSVRRVRFAVYFAASLLTASVVAHCGPIGFVGLMVPHIARFLVGPRHRDLLPACALLGAAFLCLCDVLARNAIWWLSLSSD